MNYYPFHLGDYAAHTGHLDPMEDLAYRRLLDVYYIREGPLPTDIQQVAKLVRMRSMAADVEAVLNEFFTLTDEGWKHGRCDQEIEKMQDKQALSEAKDTHEKDRMKRHRERRSHMFEALRVRGVIPAWDVSIKDLQRLHDETCNAPATHLQREQAVAAATPATAIPTPTPTPTPTPVLKGEEDAQAPVRPWMAGAICVAMKAEGMAAVNPSHPDLQVLIDKGADIGLFAAVARECVQAKKPFAYALATVAGRMRDAAALAATALAIPTVTLTPFGKPDVSRTTVAASPTADAALRHIAADAAIERKGAPQALRDRLAQRKECSTTRVEA